MMEIRKVTKFLGKKIALSKRVEPEAQKRGGARGRPPLASQNGVAPHPGKPAPPPKVRNVLIRVHI